jgi:hypothetical protein
MRPRFIPYLCAFLMSLIVIGVRAAQSNSDTNQEKSSTTLVVKITTPKTMYLVGTTIPVQIEIKNVGEKDLWIALSLDEEMGMPSNLPVWIRDTTRRRVLPEEYVHQSEFAQRMAHEQWIHLPPGYRYRREVLLSRSTSSFLAKPGKYQITVYYEGLRCGQSGLDCPSAEKSKIFTDKIESNSLWVDIVPRFLP